MSRPTVVPSWATNNNFSSGPYPGQPTKADPGSGMRAEGFDPAAFLAAEHLNFLVGNHGDWINHHDNMLVGSGFYMYDDFMGSAIDTGRWNTISAGATVGDDSSSDGFGALILTATVGNTGPSALTNGAAVATREFYYSARVRTPTYNPTGGFLLFGAIGGVTTYFKTHSGGNWFAEAAAAHDSGVAASSTYQFLEIYRRSGTLYFAIDGTVVYSEANSSDLGVQSLGAEASYVSANNTLKVDAMKFWIGR